MTVLSAIIAGSITGLVIWLIVVFLFIGIKGREMWVDLIKVVILGLITTFVVVVVGYGIFYFG